MSGSRQTLSIRSKLLAAIAAFLLVIVAISAIGLQMLRSAQNWLDTLHSETLTEVSEALVLSRQAANLATSAPFLATIQIPAQFELETQSALATIEELRISAALDDEFLLPLSRLEAAIDDLIEVAAPAATLEAQLAKTDTELVRMQGRLNRRTSANSTPVSERLNWLKLAQLTNVAIGGIRAQGLIDVGEFFRRYRNQRAQWLPTESPELNANFYQIDKIVGVSDDNAFVLKHQLLTRGLDSENALFRIRDASDQLTVLAATKVAAAEQRLKIAQAQTSRNLDVAQISIAILALLGLFAAIATAVFISRYVMANLKLITNAMRRLADGQTEVRLGKKTQPNDEIGELFDAFRVFRENARKLERHSRQIVRQNALFARVFSNINDGVAILSPEGEVEACNSNVRSLLQLGVGEDVGEKIDALLQQSEFILRESDVGHQRFQEYDHPNGQVLEVRKSNLVGGGEVWLFAETTERKKINDRLEEIRRVEALGKLTGEVAHDFGNILSTISGNLHLLETEADQATNANLSRIRIAVDMGVSLTERLLAFARRQHLDPKVTEITDLVRGLEDLLQVALPEHVVLEIRCLEQALWAKIDPGQLESAILNLCVNASQSIDEAGRIKIDVSATETGQIRISVLDNGRGMSEEVVRRAAEPFFSTQSADRGTGLGLSMVHGFVHQSGGELEIASVIGEGTEVVILLPTTAYVVVSNRTNGYPFGKVIIVDDDIDALKSIETIVNNIGFETVTAKKQVNARELLKDQKDVKLLITDLYLDNGHSGWDLVDGFLKLNKNNFCIIASSRLPSSHPFLLKFNGRLIMCEKPISKNSMLSAIRSFGILKGARNP